MFGFRCYFLRLLSYHSSFSSRSLCFFFHSFPCMLCKREDPNGRKKKMSKKGHRHVSNVFILCVSAHSIFIMTHVKPVNRWSCDSCISIGKRRVHTSSAENVCVDTVWCAWSSNITRTKWKMLKFKVGLTSFWPIKRVFFAVFESLTDILVNI